MRLHLLGINGPFPESHGATSGYLLEAGDCLFQFDLGSGVLSMLTSLTAPELLSALFISHWHFDHIADIPVLLYRLEAFHKVLPVYGPSDPDSAVFRMLSSSSSFDYHEVSPEQTVSFGNTDVHVFSARHPVPAVGYRISCCGKTICYTGDTNTLPSLEEDCRNCDLLLADGLFPAEAWNENKPHLSAELAARLALNADARSLIITHLNPIWPRQQLLEEARAVFPGARLASAADIIDL